MNENAFEKMMYAIRNYKLSWRKSQLYLHNLLFFVHTVLFSGIIQMRAIQKIIVFHKKIVQIIVKIAIFWYKKNKNNRHFHRDKSKKRHLIQSAQKGGCFWTSAFCAEGLCRAHLSGHGGMGESENNDAGGAAHSHCAGFSQSRSFVPMPFSRAVSYRS